MSEDTMPALIKLRTVEKYRRNESQSCSLIVMGLCLDLIASGMLNFYMKFFLITHIGGEVG
jgi:hypothetical protein